MVRKRLNNLCILSIENYAIKLSSDEEVNKVMRP